MSPHQNRLAETVLMMVKIYVFMQKYGKCPKIAVSSTYVEHGVLVNTRVIRVGRGCGVEQ